MISEGEMVYEIRHGFQGYTWKIGIVNRVVYKPTQIGILFSARGTYINPVPPHRLSPALRSLPCASGKRPRRIDAVMAPVMLKKVDG